MRPFDYVARKLLSMTRSGLLGMLRRCPHEHRSEQTEKERIAEQTEKNAGQERRLLREEERRCLSRVREIRLAVAVEGQATGDARDDELAVKQRRRERMVGRGLCVAESLRGVRYRLVEDRKALPDELVPEALWALPLAPDMDGIEDLLPPKIQRRMRQGQVGPVWHAEAARLRAELDVLAARAP